MKAINNGKEAPGAELPIPPSVEEMTQDQIKSWLKKDLAVAISCLNAIHSDPDMLESLAAFMLGRVKNAKQKAAINPNQTDMFHVEPKSK